MAMDLKRIRAHYRRAESSGDRIDIRLNMNFIKNFIRLFSPLAGKVHVAGRYVAMPIRRAREEFRCFRAIVKSALTDTVSLVYVTQEYVEIDRTWHRPEFHNKKLVSAVQRILGNGLPVVTAEEMQARKAQALAFDFTSME